jgi:hypothetical protein
MSLRRIKELIYRPLPQFNVVVKPQQIVGRGASGGSLGLGHTRRPIELSSPGQDLNTVTKLGLDSA